jgi:DNA-binding NarL/FixJ family response regulator
MDPAHTIIAFDVSDLLTAPITEHLDDHPEVALASSPDELLRLSATMHPIAVVFDFASFVTEAPEFVARLARVAPDAALRVVTRAVEEVTLSAVVMAGVRCLLVDEHLSMAGVLADVRAVLADPRAVIIDQRLLSQTLLGERGPDRARLPVEPLTLEDTDLRLLERLVRGETQEAIASSMNMGRSKVQRRATALQDRFHARSPREAAIFADRMGLLKDLELPPRRGQRRRRR